MDIRQDLATVVKKGARQGITRPIKSISIHNTDNTGAGANAQAHANLLKNSWKLQQRSWNYVVDDKEAICCIPDNELSWGVGNDKGNSETINIEICMNADGNIYQATMNTIELIKHLKSIYGNLPIYQHNYWSGKNCPSQLRKGIPFTWDKFLELSNGAIQQPTPTPSGDITVGDAIKIVAPYGRYIADDVATMYGMVQIRENVLAGGEHAFEWLENGIPEKVIDLTDNAGNKRADSDRMHPRKGDYFNFPNTFKVVNIVMDGGKRYLLLDFDGNSKYQFWVIGERCQKV